MLVAMKWANAKKTHTGENWRPKISETLGNLIRNFKNFFSTQTEKENKSTFVWFFFFFFGLKLKFCVWIADPKPKICVDRSTEDDCKMWKSSGFCSSHTAMIYHCKKTCDFCSSGTKAKSESWSGNDLLSAYERISQCKSWRLMKQFCDLKYKVFFFY